MATRLENFKISKTAHYPPNTFYQNPLPNFSTRLYRGSSCCTLFIVGIPRYLSIQEKFHPRSSGNRNNNRQSPLSWTASSDRTERPMLPWPTNARTIVEPPATPSQCMPQFALVQYPNFKAKTCTLTSKKHGKEKRGNMIIHQNFLGYQVSIILFLHRTAMKKILIRQVQLLSPPES